jgi:hypothetical protein
MDAGYDKPLVRLPLSYQGWPEPRQMQLDPSQLAFTGMRKDNGITEHRSGSSNGWQHDRTVTGSQGGCQWCSRENQ